MLGALEPDNHERRRVVMRVPVFLAALGFCVLTTAPAEAQSWRHQYERPGDLRCDPYWDRGRDDCHEAWRTRHLRDGPRHHRHDRRHWRAEPRPRYAPPVFRDPERVAWCDRRFRSYDPRTGYYLTYSGRWRFCG